MTEEKVLLSLKGHVILLWSYMSFLGSMDPARWHLSCLLMARSVEFLYVKTKYIEAALLCAFPNMISLCEFNYLITTYIRE